MSEVQAGGKTERQGKVGGELVVGSLHPLWVPPSCSHLQGVMGQQDLNPFCAVTLGGIQVLCVIIFSA